jgi:hypothetical protein
MLGDDAANGSRPMNPSYLVSLLIVGSVRQCRQVMQSQIATEPQHSRSLRLTFMLAALPATETRWGV